MDCIDSPLYEPLIIFTDMDYIGIACLLLVHFDSQEAVLHFTAIRSSFRQSVRHVKNSGCKMQAKIEWGEDVVWY